MLEEEKNSRLWVDVSSLLWVSIVFVCKKLLTLCRLCQASLSCHSSGKKSFPFCTYGYARDSSYVKPYEILNAGSLTVLLQVNINHGAVAGCFCTSCALWMLLWGGMSHVQFIFGQLIKELTMKDKGKGEKRNIWKVRAINWKLKHRGQDFIRWFSLTAMGKCAGYYPSS